MSGPDIPFGGHLVPSVSIANLLGQRDAIVERVRSAVALLTEAKEIAESSRMADGETYRNFARMLQGDDRYRSTDLLEPGAVDSIAARVDAGAWRLLMRESGLISLMDATARRKLEESIEKGEIPALTKENIEATFGNLYAARGEMFERGVLECFRKLSWDYKTNLPFKFGKRIVKYVRSYGSFDHGKIDELADLQRVFCIMDGKPEEDHRSGLYHRLYEAQRCERGIRTSGTHDDSYMFIRWFKNGNAHITFKRLDLVAKMNAILTKHHPNALAYDPSV